jgi:hypothetical protein
MKDMTMVIARDDAKPLLFYVFMGMDTDPNQLVVMGETPIVMRLSEFIMMLKNN